MHQAVWYEENLILSDWFTIHTVSENVWTDDDIGFKLLTSAFDLYTQQC